MHIRKTNTIYKTMIRKTLTKCLLLLGVLFLTYATAWGDSTYKLTQVTEVAAGNRYVFVEGGNALIASISSNAVQLTTGLTGSENYIWTLQSASGGFYMKMSTGKYLNNKTLGNGNMSSDNSVSSIWTFAFTDGFALITNISNENRFLGNTSENTYKTYSSSSLDYYSHNFTVYLVEEEEGPAICNVSYHVGDDVYNVERANGATLSLDDPSPIGGMEFAGWSSSNDVTSPVWVANSTVVNSDLELWAFFTIEAPTVGYYLVEAAQDDWRGDYLIAYSSTLFADGRKGGTGTDGIAAENVMVNPGDKLSGKVVDASWGDAYSVSLLAVNDNNLASGYVLRTQDGKYNYCTASSSSWATTTTKSTAGNHPFTLTFNSSSNITMAVHTYTLQYNTTSNWFHFYSSTYAPVYLYKRAGMPGVYSLGKSKSLNIGSAKYNTYCSNEGLDFSGTGAKVYKAKVVGNAVKLTEIEGGVVPANTGVLVYKDVNETVTLNIPVTLTDVTVTDNELIGVTAVTTIPWEVDGKYNYILQKDTEDGKAKFFKATGKKLVANRAYLSTAYDVNDSGALEMVFEGEEEDVTGVMSVAKPQTTVKQEVYNLAGLRVAQPTKGIYLVNGKKYIVK